jgi:phosphohistidine phosphatase SixA/plastocyanin
MVRHNDPETISEDTSMRSHQLTHSSPMTSHRGIGSLLSAVLLAGFGAPANAQYAGAITYLGRYSSTAPTTPSAKRATASPVAVRLSEWKLELSQLTVPTGEVEITVKNGGSMPHALEIEGQGFEKELEPINAGATSKLRLNLPPGTYELYCPIGDGAHEKMGMIAHIEVIGSVNLEQLVTDMKKGGYVIVFRHGATNADQADTDPLHRDNIGSQRLLSEKGRDVAKHVGDSFRTLGIPLGRVYSSEFNRATETAQLVSGKSPTTTADLTEGGLVVSPAENARRAKALKALAIVVPETGSNTLIVTHKPNILDAFGEGWFASMEGEASVFKPDGSNNQVLVARVQAADFIRAAGEQ